MSPFAARYAQWVTRHHRALVLLSMVVALVAGSIAARLPVHADFSYLLPPSAESVRHLRALEKRTRVLGTLMIAVKSEDPVARKRAAHAVRDEIVALGPSVAEGLTFDERVGRAFGWQNRWLYLSEEDLLAARDAISQTLGKKALGDNPLYVDFEDEPVASKTLDVAAASHDATMQKLRARLADAERTKDDPGELVSKDGTLQMMVLRTSFSSGDVEGDQTNLLARVKEIVQRVRAATPGVDIGLAGDVLASDEEHKCILTGMVRATLVTFVLVFVALLLYYRSVWGVGALCWALSVGIVLTFMVTELAIGHLNVATAFLSSIVAGNGINFGIMLLARHMEARRTGASAVDALAKAISGTWRGTLAAALTAAVAYLSLVVTDFRGFRHFGIIGSVGMVLSWASAYAVLPAALALAEAYGLVKPHKEPKIGVLMAKLLPRRSKVVALVGLGLTCLASVWVWHYLAHDPYENNMRNLRSHSPGLTEEARWMHEIDKGFGQGISGGFVIGLARRDEVKPLQTRLAAIDAGVSEKERLFSRLNSIDDLLPRDQDKKLRLLAEIRNMLSDNVIDSLDPADSADVLRLRPPADLKALTDADLPEAIAWPFIEVNGERGKLMFAMSGWGYEIWDAHDLVRFADRVRSLDLGTDVLLGGSAFVFADMLRLIEHDGPRATLAAVVGAVLMVLLILGLNRQALVTLLCGLSGVVLLIAMAAWVGLRVNFLDFVALPITVGIGIDYAVNICARHKQDGPGSARRALATAGGAVFMSSYTTIVGYGALLLSANQGIRSFGAAAILGEATCLVAAVFLAPSLLAWWDGQSLPNPHPQASP